MEIGATGCVRNATGGFIFLALSSRPESRAFRESQWRDRGKNQTHPYLSVATHKIVHR